jgi:NAD-dependent SIR2 family protein deacetylase
MAIHTRKVLRCPVGKEALGYRFDGEMAEFECTDCDFIYSWDKNGRLLPPEKKKKPPKLCNCGNCQP